MFDVRPSETAERVRDGGGGARAQLQVELGGSYMRGVVKGVDIFEMHE